MSSHSKDRALALVPAGAAVAAGARAAAARQQRALVQWAAGGCIMRSEYTGYTRVYERTVLELNVLSCHACRAESPLIQRSTLHSTLLYSIQTKRSLGPFNGLPLASSNNLILSLMR